MNEHDTTTVTAGDEERFRAAGAAVRGRAAVVPPVSARQARARQQRRRTVMTVAAVAFVVGVLVTVVTLHSGDGTVTTAGPVSPPSGPAVDWQTPTVRLAADGVRIVANGETFTPPTDASQIEVHSDPGTVPPQGYTTLEVTWQEHGVEMRINIYFKSDNSRWWADEIRIYDGKSPGEWIEFHGRYFDSPLGQPYTGSLQVSARGGSLAMSGLRMLAFPSPAECTGSGGRDTLQSLYPTIPMEAGGSFGAAARLYDGNCQVVSDFSGITFNWTTEDPSVANVQGVAEGCPTVRSPKTCPTAQGDITAVAPGTTTVSVTANDKATGAVLATTTMQVTVR